MTSNFRPGKIEIEEISILNYNGAPFDLQPFVLSFDMYEDIFNQSMSGSVTLLDGNGLIERLPIVGDERFYIQFRHPLNEEFYSKYFVPYKISERIKVSDRAEIYTIELVSNEFLRSQVLLADKSYTGFYISDIVKDVYNIIKDPDEDFRRPITIEQTIGKHQFIAPESQPLDFVNLLASEARSEKYPYSSSFLFFENQEGYHFRTIASLFEQEPIYDYVYGESNVEESMTAGKDLSLEKDRIIEEITFDNVMDVVGQTSDGLFDNSIKVIDPIFKRKQDINFVYENEFNKLSSLGSNKIFSNKSPRSLNKGDSHSRLFVGNLSEGNYYQTSYLDRRCTPIEPLSYYPSQRYRFLNTKIAHQASLKNISMNLKVPGNNIIKAGDIVNVFINLTSEEVELKGTLNPFFGDNNTKAKFLVVRVNHTFEKESETYSTHLKVVKDSYANPIVSEDLRTGSR